jgi:hypothetical protein
VCELIADSPALLATAAQATETTPNIFLTA